MELLLLLHKRDNKCVLRGKEATPRQTWTRREQRIEIIALMCYRNFKTQTGIEPV